MIRSRSCLSWPRCPWAGTVSAVTGALSTSLSIENRRRWERELLDYYVDHLQEAAAEAIPRDTVFDNYRQQLFSVLSYWTITINPAPGMPEMQPQDSTLAFIARIATAIDDVDALDSFR